MTNVTKLLFFLGLKQVRGVHMPKRRHSVQDVIHDVHVSTLSGGRQVTNSARTGVPRSRNLTTDDVILNDSRCMILHDIIILTYCTILSFFLHKV